MPSRHLTRWRCQQPWTTRQAHRAARLCTGVRSPREDVCPNKSFAPVAAIHFAQPMRSAQAAVPRRDRLRRRPPNSRRAPMRTRLTQLRPCPWTHIQRQRPFQALSATSATRPQCRSHVRRRIVQARKADLQMAPSSMGTTSQRHPKPRPSMPPPLAPPPRALPPLALPPMRAAPMAMR